MTDQPFPLYLVCDESTAMSEDAIAALNSLLREDLTSAPGWDSVVRFIGFARDAREASLTEEAGPFTRNASDIPRYGAVFRLLRRLIARDGASFEDQEAPSAQPLVFFLTGGDPGDDWHQAYGGLANPSWPLHPEIVPFGFGTVKEQTLRSIATGRAFFAEKSTETIAAMMTLVDSVVDVIEQIEQVSMGAVGWYAAPETLPGYRTLTPGPPSATTQEPGAPKPAPSPAGVDPRIRNWSRPQSAKSAEAASGEAAPASQAPLAPQAQGAAAREVPQPVFPSPLIIPRPMLISAQRRYLLFKLGTSRVICTDKVDTASFRKVMRGFAANDATIPVGLGPVDLVTPQVSSGSLLMLATGGLIAPMHSKAVLEHLTSSWGSGDVPDPLEFAWQLSFRADGAVDDRTAICLWVR